MVDVPSTVLPDEFSKVAMLAPVPLELRTFVQHLGPWTLDARLPAHPAQMSLAERQLLKLALIPSDAMTLASVAPAGDPSRVCLRVSRRGRGLSLGPQELSLDMPVLLRRLLAELAEPSELAEVGETLALALVREQTVRKLSSRMLQAADLDEALYAMLLGITSGYGASFHRAALFVYDDASRSFRGSIAIGPRDEHEAHRVWEAIETEDKSLDQALDDYAKMRERPSDFEQFVRTLALAESAGDELAEALAAGAPRVFGAPPRNPSLAKLLAPATEFVVSVIQPRGTRLGVLVADNAYGREPILGGQVECLRALVDPTSLVWDIRSLLRKVDSLARHDPLTGLCNRREFGERLAVEQSRCGRLERPISLAVIDVDHFKRVNDTYGHLAGDAVLARLARVSSGIVRAEDVLARYGGEEFAIICRGVTLADAGVLAERLRATVESTLFEVDGAALPVTISIGVAAMPESVAQTGSELVLAADAALYQAKRAGRNRVVLKS
jgi:diguanylate cyclase (GGDEF)-like protein